MVKPQVAVWLGVAVNLLGFVWWRGPGRSTSIEEYVALVGNDFRSDSLVSITGIVGNLLFFGGVATLLRRRHPTSRRFRFVSLLIAVLAVSAAVLDAVRVAIGLVAVGSLDLDVPLVELAAPDWQTESWYPLFLGGLYAFVSGVVLCLLGLTASAVKTHVHVEAPSSKGRGRFRIKPTVALWLGVVLYLFGSIGLVGPGEVTSLDGYVAHVGEGFRLNTLVSLVGTVGYVLFFCWGVATLLRRQPGRPRLLSLLAWALILVAGVAAAADLASLAIGLIAVGTQDLRSPLVITAPEWMTNAWYPLFSTVSIAVTTGLALSVIGLIMIATVGTAELTSEES